VSKLTEEQKRRIEVFADLCFRACVRVEDAVMHGDSDTADMDRARAAYWSGRAFGVVLS
jgi:hypothetical protein